MKKIIIMTLALAIFSVSVRGQGFLNLDFESAQTGTNNPGLHSVLVSVTNALPSWAAYNGNMALSKIYYATSYLDLLGTVGLVGSNTALSGNFSVWLGDTASISQTGLVPADAESLRFWTDGSLLGAGLEVSLGGQSLSYSALSQNANYWVYGANIPSGMAGQMESLTFLTQGAGSGYFRLDNIAFVVPEPSEPTLLGLAAILFALRRRRQQKQRLHSP